MQAKDVIKKWKEDLHNLQMQLAEKELSRKKVIAEMKETPEYQQKLEFSREIRKLRMMIDERSNKLSGVEELFNELKRHGKDVKPTSAGKVITMGAR